MNWGRALFLVGMLAVPMPLAGCVLFVRGVHDLKFAGIQPVEVGALNLHASYPMRPSTPETHKIVKLEVETTADIHRIAVDSELNIWTEMWNCKTGATIAEYDGILYYHDIQVNDNSTTPEIQKMYAGASISQKRGEPFRYDFYFEPRSDLSQPRGPGQPQMFKTYNLAKTPFDICFHVGGGNMLYGHFVSNTVVIPASFIAKAVGQQSGA